MTRDSLRGAYVEGLVAHFRSFIPPQRNRVGKQQEPADDRHMLQAGRQLVPEFGSAAEPEAVPDQRSRNRKAGEHKCAKPREEARGDQASANQLGKDGGTRESSRPGQSVAPNLFDARR
jgi:hypothetical protein